MASEQNFIIQNKSLIK